MPLPTPIEVRVVVVTMFELGADTGDAPGEFQHWVEGEHLTRRFPLPEAYHDALMNRDGVLGIVTGQGAARAASTIMALGRDPRFDFSHAYWLIAGIGGVDPAVASLGSAVWTEWVVDGDLAYEIDAREMPPAWPTGYVPLGETTPFEQPRKPGSSVVFHLNPALAAWAYAQTKDIKLTDTPEMQARRLSFAPAAGRLPPFVLRGDELSASTYWHGKLMNAWAREWVRYQTDGQGTYAICAMEDSGTLQSLTWLARAGRVDLNRVLVLRTASNYDQQRDGATAAESLAESRVARYGGYLPSLEAAYRVGDRVVRAIVEHWGERRAGPPAAGTPTP